MLLAPAFAAAQTKKAASTAARDFSKAQGSPAAPVKVEVFSDYQCPACANLHIQTVRPLVTDYVRSGKVYLVNRDFPLAGHPYARPAALLATAAAGIGRYEVVSDTFFRKQGTWSGDGKLDPVLIGVLSSAEIKTLHELAAAPEVARAVEQDVALGVQAGIRQTPTLFVIRGQRRYPFSGAVSYAILQQAIEALLKQ